MNDIIQLVDGVVSVALFLTALPALWISGRIVLRNYTGEYRALQIVLWLTLGGLILIPFMDFLRYLSFVLDLIIPSSGKFNSISVFLGMAPFLFYSTITLVLGIVVYGLTLYYARKLLAQGKLPFVRGLVLGNWEFGFVLLGIAGLVNRMVNGIVANFVNIRIPGLTDQLDLAQLSKGFWISWLIAFIILTVTLFCMNELLFRRENKLIP